MLGVLNGGIQKRTFRTVRLGGGRGWIRGDERWVRVRLDEHGDPYAPDSEEEDEVQDMAGEVEVTADQEKQGDSNGEDQLTGAGKVQDVAIGDEQVTAAVEGQVVAVGDKQDAAVTEVQAMDRETLLSMLKIYLPTYFDMPPSGST